MKTVVTTAFLALIALTALAQNPLQPPNHRILFGYYKLDSQYGQYFDEPVCYTNMVRTGPDDYADDTWPNKVANTLFKTAAAGKRIYLTLSMDPTCGPAGDCSAVPPSDIARIDQVLALAAPFWDLVDLIELSDEPSWAPATAINLRVDTAINRIAANGLPAKPLSAFGAVYGAKYIDTLGIDNRIANSKLGWVGLEAFVDAPESSLASCDNILLLRQRIADAKARVGNKNISLVMQAYDRNGCWNTVNTIQNLVDLQNATYDLARNDSRVVALTMFNYGREGGCDPCGTPPCGGTHRHPELAAAHRQMGERILGLGGYPACGPGPYSYVNAAACNPGQPRNLQATASGFQVSLTWNNRGASGSGIGVQRMTNNAGGWVQIASLPWSASSYVDKTSPLRSGAVVTYSYRVYAISDLGNSPFSNVASVTLYGDLPAVPVLVAPKDCITTLRPAFTWSATPRATSYYIAVTRADIENFFVNQPGVNGTTYNLSSNLLAGIQYRWKVKACNNLGCGNWASSTFFKTFCSGVGTTITAPLGCIATLTPTFTWRPVAGAVNYWLLVANSPDFSAPTTRWFVNVSTTATSYAPGVVFAPHTTYYAKVKTHVAPNSTAGGWSATISFTPLCPDSAPR